MLQATKTTEIRYLSPTKGLRTHYRWDERHESLEPKLEWPTSPCPCIDLLHFNNNTEEVHTVVRATLTQVMCG